jgi:hypothetical protein
MVNNHQYNKNYYLTISICMSASGYIDTDFGPNARFDWGMRGASLAIDSNNNLYVGEREKRIRKVTTN